MRNNPWVLCYLVPIFISILLMSFYNTELEPVVIVFETTSVADENNKTVREIRIERDEYGIPHIYADSANDFVYGLGYAMGQDRLWQIDILRRIGSGRMSELFGASTYELDLFIRNIKIPRIVQNNIEKLPKDSRRMLESFADGINMAAKDHWKPIEYYLTWSYWEDFTIKDPYSITYLTVLGLAGSWGNDILKYQLNKAIGNITDYLLPTDKALVNPLSFIISNEELPKEIKKEKDLGKNEAKIDEDIEIFSKLDIEDMGTASNGWIISGNYTKSGKPILSNDPHLPSQIPTVWYFSYGYLPNIKLSGVFCPGNPVINAGKINNLAWGVTSLKSDDVDIFIEKIKENTYLYGDEYKELIEFEEEIVVKGEGTKIVKFKETIHGPILIPPFASAKLFSYPLPDVSEVNLAFCWSAYNNDDDLPKAFKAALKAKNINDFRNAVSHVKAFKMAMLAGSVSGDILFQSTGAIPIRNHSGDLPVPGWLPEYTWNGFIPFEEMPYVINPEKGYIVMANNYPVGEDYKHFQAIGKYFSQGRAERITELIEHKIKLGQKFTSEDQLSMQRDELNIFARESLHSLLKMINDVGPYKEQYETLKSWDYIMSTDSLGSSLYSVWIKKIAENLLKDKVPVDKLQAYMKSLVMQSGIHRIFTYKDQSISKLCDNPLTNTIESCRDLVTNSFKEACEFVGDKKWGDIHHIKVYHNPFSKNKYLDWIFSRTDKVGGLYSTVHSTHFNWYTDDYNSVMSPGMILIIDLGNSTENYWSLQTGMSGNIFSKHYDDMFSEFHYGNIPKIAFID